MEWYYVLLLMILMLFVFLLSGMPVAFAFMALNFLAIYILMGGTSSFVLVVHSAFNILNSFILAPVPLFVIMGMILFHSGLGWLIIDALDKWIGHIPGRLSVLSVIAGTVFAVVSGVPMGTTAMLGSVFVPEMKRRGYSSTMSIGPVLGGGSLAMLIPPSAMAVILGGLADVSIGHLLIASVVPGVLLAALYAAYILVQAVLHPELAPKYEGPAYTRRERINSLGYIIPLAGVVFLVTGVIFLGIATPTESAATGALAAFILVAVYGKLSWPAFNKSLLGSVNVSVMVMMIIMGSVAFCQLMAYTGCTHALARFASNLKVHPILIVITMQMAVVVLGCFMDLISITMITIPIFMPVIKAIHLDPIWFCTIMLLNLGAATLTPPFGILLFTMKGVAPPDVTMAEIIRAAIPYFFMNYVVIALVLLVPSVALWLPSLMQ